jgi:hypothetical protein
VRGMSAAARAYTVSTRALLRVVQGDAVDYPDGVVRPRTRAECERGVRPCPFVSCRFNLALDIGRRGSLKVNRPEESCVLDVADEGGATRDRIGAAMGISRDAVRLIETAAIAKLREAGLLEP